MNSSFILHPSSFILHPSSFILHPSSFAERWEGVDKTVVERFAAEAGHPARPPFFNTDQGDLLLFLFLIAGTVGGFIAGYAFRSLFPPKRRPEVKHG
ncbi:MAG: hypothetical protein ABSF26_05605 [Thermoguttaceae bacterium]|jgi:cobalt/nickel transport system permease protein